MFLHFVTVLTDEDGGTDDYVPSDLRQIKGYEPPSLSLSVFLSLSFCVSQSLCLSYYLYLRILAIRQESGIMLGASSGHMESHVLLL